MHKIYIGPFLKIGSLWTNKNIAITGCPKCKERFAWGQKFCSSCGSESSTFEKTIREPEHSRRSLEESFRNFIYVNTYTDSDYYIAYDVDGISREMHPEADMSNVFEIETTIIEKEKKLFQGHYSNDIEDMSKFYKSEPEIKWGTVVYEVKEFE